MNGIIYTLRLAKRYHKGERIGFLLFCLRDWVAEKRFR